jgi:hypothetical protein
MYGGCLCGLCRRLSGIGIGIGSISIIMAPHGRMHAMWVLLSLVLLVLVLLL